MKSGALVTLAGLLLLLTPRTAAADADDDCIGASERAVKLSRAGTLLLAREELSACSALVCAEALRTSCASRLTELNAQIPTMVFRATDARGADTAAVRLFVDGKLVAESLTGQAIAVDPGSHTFRFEAAQVDAGRGAQTIEKQWLVREGEKGRALAVSFAPPDPAPVPVAPPPAGVQSGEPARPGHHKAGLVIGGVGGIGLGLGAVFGAMAISQWNGAKDRCTTTVTCAPGSPAQRDHDAAAVSATISTVSLIAGAALFAGGAAFFFWPAAPDGAPRGASFGVRAEF